MLKSDRALVKKITSHWNYAYSACKCEANGLLNVMSWEWKSGVTAAITCVCVSLTKKETLCVSVRHQQLWQNSSIWMSEHVRAGSQCLCIKKCILNSMRWRQRGLLKYSTVVEKPLTHLHCFSSHNLLNSFPSEVTKKSWCAIFEYVLYISCIPVITDICVCVCVAAYVCLIIHYSVEAEGLGWRRNKVLVYRMMLTALNRYCGQDARLSLSLTFIQHAAGAGLNSSGHWTWILTNANL